MHLTTRRQHPGGVVARLRAGRDPGRRRPPAPDRDRGAGLILAIGFVTLVGALTAGLAGLVTSGLNDRVLLDQLRNKQYAADAAVEEAITVVRGMPRSGTGSASCSSSGGSRSTTLNSVTIRVDWRIACGVVRGSDGSVVAQRNAGFVACVDAGTACATGKAIVSAQVNLQEAATGGVTRTFVQSWSVTP